MHGTMQMALAALLVTAMPAWAQGTAAAPDASTTARRAGSAGNAGNAGNAFTIDQKGVKRSAAPGGTTAAEQKPVKKTGDPLPEVDVSYKRPPSTARVQAPATDKATTPAATTTAQGAAGGTRK